MYKALYPSCFSVYISVAFECPVGMVYQQCGQACPQTCDTVGRSDCASGCVEGCYCPNGTVLQEGNCINAPLCAGIQKI